MRQIAKMRSMKGYKSISEERLVSSINKSNSVKKNVKKILMVQE